MRGALVRLLAGLVASVPMAFFVPAADAVPSGRTAVFLTPHQDDETTSMGVAIEHAVRAGVHVVVVLLTDGSESGQCYKRYGDGESVRRQRDDGGLPASARAMCTEQRDAEFKAAVTALRADYLIRADRKQDDCTNAAVAEVVTSCGPANTLTKGYVRSVIDALVKKYGADTSFGSMSYLEARHCDACDDGTTGAGSPDHAVIGRALLAAYHAGDVSHVRFYIKPSLWNVWPGPDDARPIGHWMHARINGVLRKYGSDAPDGDGDGPTVAGDGIGEASTRDQCEQFDPRPGTDGTSEHMSPALDCTGFDYFGEGPDAVFGGQDPNYPDIADGGADCYVHRPDVSLRGRKARW